MKKVIISVLKFMVLFVPAYLAIGCFIPEMKAQILAAGFLQSVLRAVKTGLPIAVFFIGGTYLIDKWNQKKEKTSEE